MDEKTANSIASDIKRRGWRSLEFYLISQSGSEYRVEASYTGPKMAYAEPSGRQHRLRPGLLKIDSNQEYEDLLLVLTKGVNVEF